MNLYKSFSFKSCNSYIYANGIHLQRGGVKVFVLAQIMSLCVSSARDLCSKLLLGQGTMTLVLNWAYFAVFLHHFVKI